MPYSFVKSAYRIAISSPGYLLTAVLYLQANVLNALPAPAPLARYNQCPLQKKSLFVNTCPYEDELYNHYDIVTNAPSLTEVKHFLFANYHDNAEEKNLIIHSLNTLVTPRDVILFEGIDFSTQILCSSYYDIDNDYHASVDINNPDSRLPDLSLYENVKHYGLTDDLVCKGWDNQSLANEHGEILLPIQLIVVELVKLIDDVLLISEMLIDSQIRLQTLPITDKELRMLLKSYCDDLLDNIKIHTSLLYYTPIQEDKRQNFLSTAKTARAEDAEVLLVELNHITIEFEDHLRAVHAEYNKKLKIIGDKTIIARNKVAIKTFNFYSSMKGRTFSLFGHNHLRDPHHIPAYKSISQIDDDDAALEFRQALDKHPYAILFSKH
jgi:hypothetical protein